MRSRWGTVTFLSDHLGGTDIQLNFSTEHGHILLNNTLTLAFSEFSTEHGQFEGFSTEHGQFEEFSTEHGQKLLQTHTQTHKPHIEVGAPPKNYKNERKLFYLMKC